MAKNTRKTLVDAVNFFVNFRVAYLVIKPIQFLFLLHHMCRPDQRQRVERKRKKNIIPHSSRAPSIHHQAFVGIGSAS